MKVQSWAKGGGLWGGEQGSDLNLGPFKFETGPPCGDVKQAFRRPPTQRTQHPGVTPAFLPSPAPVVPIESLPVRRERVSSASSSHWDAKSRTPPFC